VSSVKEPIIIKATNAMIPDTTNSPGDAVLIFPPNMVILLLLSTRIGIHHYESILFAI
jgi:hypothetical protein